MFKVELAWLVLGSQTGFRVYLVEVTNTRQYHAVWKLSHVVPHLLQNSRISRARVIVKIVERRGITCNRPLRKLFCFQRRSSLPAYMQTAPRQRLNRPRRKTEGMQQTERRIWADFEKSQFGSRCIGKKCRPQAYGRDDEELNSKFWSRVCFWCLVTARRG